MHIMQVWQGTQTVFWNNVLDEILIHDIEHLLSLRIISISVIFMVLRFQERDTQWICSVDGQCRYPLHLFLSYWNTQYWPVHTVYESTMIASSALDNQVRQEQSLNNGRFAEYESLRTRTDSWALCWAMDRPNLRSAATAKKGEYLCLIAGQTIATVSKNASLSSYVEIIVFEIWLTESIPSYRHWRIWMALILEYLLSIYECDKQILFGMTISSKYGSKPCIRMRELKGNPSQILLQQRIAQFLYWAWLIRRLFHCH